MTEKELIKKLYEKKPLKKNETVVTTIDKFLCEKSKDQALDSLHKLKNELLAAHDAHKRVCNPKVPCQHEGINTILHQTLDEFIRREKDRTEKEKIPKNNKTRVKILGILSTIGLILSIGANWKKIFENSKPTDIQEKQNDNKISNSIITNIYITYNLGDQINIKEIEKSIKPIILNDTKIFIDKIGYKIKDDGKASVNLNNCLVGTNKIDLSLSYTTSTSDSIKEYGCNSIGIHNEKIGMFIKDKLLFQSMIEISIIDQDTICGPKEQNGEY